MPNRTLALITAAMGIAIVTAMPAQAQFELEYAEIEGGELTGPQRIEAGYLEERLESWDFFLLFGPAFNSSSKGDEPPPGRLGARFEITYAVSTIEGKRVVKAREHVYPFARPNPVAFTLKGQKQAFGRRPYPIPWGWHPFPEEAAILIFDRRPGEDDSVSGVDLVVPDAAWPVRTTIIAAGVLTLIGLWLHWRSKRTI